MEEQTQKLIEECQRQEESCLYTSTVLFEWLKSLRLWKTLFVIVPIVLGGVATWPLLAHQDTYKWVTGACALLAGLFPAVYKALEFDVNLSGIAKHANEFKSLQDRFRQSWRVSALGAFADFRKEFDDLMKRMDTARAASIVAPERFFKKAQAKIHAGHYSFAIDSKSQS